jgi:hypothetical protein
LINRLVAAAGMAANNIRLATIARMTTPLSRCNHSHFLQITPVVGNGNHNCHKPSGLRHQVWLKLSFRAGAVWVKAGLRVLMYSCNTPAAEET